MLSHASRVLVTVLMLTPVVAVPLFAVIGIPRFMPVAAAPGYQTVSVETDGVGESLHYAAADLFAPLEKTADPRLHVEPLTWESYEVSGDPFLELTPQSDERADFPRKPSARIDSSSHQALAGWEIQASRGPMQTISHGRKKTDDDSPVALPPMSQSERLPSHKPDRTNGIPHSPVDIAANARPRPFTWQAATRRLNELGIRRFRLEPGRRANEFLFSCFLTPSDNPRVTQRFEAEANEPLRAVQKVLAQIDEWSTLP